MYTVKKYNKRGLSKGVHNFYWCLIIQNETNTSLIRIDESLILMEKLKAHTSDTDAACKPKHTKYWAYCRAKRTSTGLTFT